MLENKKVAATGIHYSRYIASWNNSGRPSYYNNDYFKEWLLSEGLTSEEIRDVVEMATCGKLELEESCKAYIKALNEYIKSFDD